MPRERARLVVVVTAIGLAAFAVAVAFRWDALATRYYELRFRSNPRELVDWLDSPSDTPRGAAVASVAATAPGRHALLRAFAEHLAEEVDHRESPVVAALTINGGRRMWFDTSYSGRKLEPGETYCDRHGVARSLRAWLPSLVGETFDHEDAPGYELQVLAWESAAELHRRPVSDDEAGTIFWFGGDRSHVLQVRPRAPEGERARAQEGASP